MRIEVSKGELIDKITILEIKDDRVKDEEKLKNIRHELDVLLKYEFETPLKERLKVVNNALWDFEDATRKLEDKGDFGEKFIKLARNIYNTESIYFECKFRTVKRSASMTLRCEIINLNFIKILAI